MKRVAIIGLVLLAVGCAHEQDCPPARACPRPAAKRQPSRSVATTLSALHRRRRIAEQEIGAAIVDTLEKHGLDEYTDPNQRRELVGRLRKLVGRYLRTAENANCRQQIGLLKTAVKHFSLETRKPCPMSLRVLVDKKLVLITTNLRDPWGEPFVYRCPGTHDKKSADISSKGPDRAAGTSDDITSWEKDLVEPN